MTKHNIPSGFHIPCNFVIRVRVNHEINLDECSWSASMAYCSQDYKLFCWAGVMRQAASRPRLVAGLVCQSADVVVSPGLLQLTPGVSLSCGTDALGQQYNTPQSVVCERGADLAVVGRAIINADNPAATAKEFKTQLWDAYLERTSK